MSKGLRSNELACGVRALIIAVVLLASAGCSGNASDEQEFLDEAYVGTYDAALRDRLGPGTRVVDTLPAGERVRIYEQHRVWRRVRTASDAEGWVHARNLITEEEYGEAQSLVPASAGRRSQGRARALYPVRLHSKPDRHAPALFLIEEGEECEVLDHEAVPDESKGDKPPDDWHLVRGEEKAGWLLARHIAMAIPEDVGQYSEGQPIAAWALLDEVEHKGKKWGQYVWATRSRPGMPYDFDGIRVFIWSTQRNRYETAYRERGLRGIYPLVNGRLEWNGRQWATFTVSTLDEAGNETAREFVLLGNIVRPREALQ